MKTELEYEGGLVAVRVKDVDRAVRFYVDVLGLKKKAHYGSSWAEVEAPGVNIGLHPQREDGNSRNLSIGLQVKDIDAAVVSLSSKGVKFSDIKDESFIRVAHFTDTDGNPLYLCQVKRWS